MSRPDDPITPTDVDRMRAFAAAVLTGRPAPSAPEELVRRGNLGPLAYSLGLLEHRDDYAASLIVSLRRQAVLAEVLATLRTVGVRAALLKGCGLTGTIYPDPATRPMLDLDLLVPAPRMADAARALYAIGFARAGRARTLSGYSHAVAFSRADMVVELHRNIVQHSRTAIRAGDLWRRAGPDPLGSGGERLDRVDELLVCMVHVARHELAVPLLNYVDVARLTERLDAAERAELDRRAREFEVTRAIAAVRSMTELLAMGATGHPALGLGSTVLPTTDDVLRGVRPRRARQIAQKLLLTDGPLQIAGLGFAHAWTALDGLRRER
ncbi:MAG: nucleotidyltransferase family protein [Hyalangium sp.]|uniref:nucleotidyltransferase family protein n=1 Tax=Hyalangium sp. TaxID=2028555 RepID=UPI003899B074